MIIPRLSFETSLTNIVTTQLDSPDTGHPSLPSAGTNSEQMLSNTTLSDFTTAQLVRLPDDHEWKIEYEGGPKIATQASILLHDPYHNIRELSTVGQVTAMQKHWITFTLHPQGKLHVPRKRCKLSLRQSIKHASLRRILNDTFPPPISTLHPGYVIMMEEARSNPLHFAPRHHSRLD
jgi:hypothetical protein